MPGSASLYQSTSENISQYYEFPVFLDFVVKSGRAVFYPIYKGTFERKIESFSIIHEGSETHEYAEILALIVKDFRTSVDYIEIRDDIDPKKIAYYGMSWGAMIGPIICAVENRIKTNIFLSGGLSTRIRPEALPLNFLPRVKAPTIMLNGRYDSVFPLHSNIEPLFALLGTPVEHKKLVLFDSDHIPPHNDMIREILTWLDIYLGPVKPLQM